MCSILSKLALVVPLMLVATLPCATQFPINLAGFSGTSGITLVAHTGATAPSNTSVTTSAINSTGGSLEIVSIGWVNVGGSPSLSDSKSNVLTALTQYTDATAIAQQFYNKNPAVGTGHSFTNTSTNGTYSSITGTIFRRTDTTAGPTSESGATATSATSLQPGSVSTSVGNLVFSTLGYGGSAGASISGSGWTMIDDIDGGGVNINLATAYKIQGTAGPENPTWSVPGAAAHMVATIAVYK